jgi:MFS family permease
MSSNSSASARTSTLLIVVATVILLITMGARQSTGLFVLPIIKDTGIGIASISFALAIGQFVWGAAQPVFGAMADRYGPYRMVIGGGVVFAIGAALTPYLRSEAGLMLTMGFLMAAGAGAGSFSILIGATARNLAPEKRSVAAGFINAGGSLGQFLFAPLMQAIIAAWGWASGMYAIAVAALLTIPLAFLLRERKAGGAQVARAKEDGEAASSDGNARVQASAQARDEAALHRQAAAHGRTDGAAALRGADVPEQASASARGGGVLARRSASDSTARREPSSLGEQLQIALRNPSYLFLHLGFFTCGFHVAFLVTHFPSDLQLCGLNASVAANSIALIGLFNVAGSLGAGWLGQRYRMKNLLALIYASRAVLIVIYLLMPKTAFNVYLFAGGLGLTWLATVPPTSGIIGKLFDVRYLATLFGLALLSHQIGGFLGAYLGGIAVAKTGSYQYVWYADVALALAAAALNLPIREPKPIRRLAAAT